MVKTVGIKYFWVVTRVQFSLRDINGLIQLLLVIYCNIRYIRLFSFFYRYLVTYCSLSYKTRPYINFDIVIVIGIYHINIMFLLLFIKTVNTFHIINKSYLACLLMKAGIPLSNAGKISTSFGTIPLFIKL